MREVALEQYLTGKVERLQGLAWKWVSPGNAGVPDRLVIVPHEPCPCCGAQARVAAVELKAPGQKPRSLQHRQIERLQQAGLPAGWVSSHLGVDALLASLTKPVKGELH